MKTLGTIGIAAFALSIGTAQAATISAVVTNGIIDESITWEGSPTMPTSPDTNVWSSTGEGYNLFYGPTNGSDNVSTFYGGTFVLEAGSTLSPGAVGNKVNFQNFTFNGGRLQNSRNTDIAVGFSGSNVVVATNSVIRSTANNRHISISNAVWSGSADLYFETVDAGSDGLAKLNLHPNNNLDNYSGTIHVSGVPTVKAALNVTAPTVGSFGLDVGNGGLFTIGATSNFFSTLVLGGEAIAEGTYSFGVFTSYQRQFLGAGNGIVYVGSTTNPLPASIFNWAVVDGPVNAGATWNSGAAPVVDDTATWSSGGFALTFSNATFNGHTFELVAGSTLAPAVAGNDPFFRNFTFDGGTLLNNKNTLVDVGFGGSNVVVTANGGKFSSNGNGRAIRLLNGILSGDGDLSASYTANTGTANFRFNSDFSMTNYTGTILVTTGNTNAHGRLSIQTVTDGSFGISLANDGSQLLFEGYTNTYASVAFGTNSLAPGSYTSAALIGLGYATYLSGTPGLITVVDNTPPTPEPDPAVLFIASGAGMVTLSTTNLSDHAGVTNYLQYKNDLVFDTAWSNLSAVTGVTATNWVVTPAAKTYYRIESTY